MTHPEFEAEQAYVDNAYACLDRMRGLVERAAGAGVGEIASLALEAWSTRRLRTFEDAERGLCFGRLTLDGGAQPVYVGRRWVHDDDQQVLVVNWQAPAARPFYTATPAEPQRVTVRRRFRAQGRRLLDLSDETLDGTGTGAALGDFLLEELARSREAYMRDVVATIQTDQYRLITRDPEGILVVQGGPGTGKTAVGLHRASFLLYSFRDRLRRVLVVGPNPTFMEYVSHVLPSLGEEAVEQRAVGELVEDVLPVRPDAPDIARLKGDVRLAAVVARAAELRQEPEPEDLYARLEGALVTVRAREVHELLDAARAELGVSAPARERFRMNVLRRFYEHYGRILGGAAVRDFAEVERALRRNGFLNGWLDRVWPFPAADALVRSLLTQRARLAEAANGLLSGEEQGLLLRERLPRGEWTESDIALLDEARALLSGGGATYGHVILDEAQDLTPMQLRMIARRAPSGSITVLGDIAGNRPDRVPPLGRAPSPSPGWRPGPDRRPPFRLPRAARDHGARAAAACADRPRRGGASRLSRRGAPSDPASCRGGRALGDGDGGGDTSGRGGGASRRDRARCPRGDGRGHAGRVGIRRRDSAPHPARRQGPRVRPRDRRRARTDRGGGAGPAWALRCADPADEDARGRVFAAAAGSARVENSDPK